MASILTKDLITKVTMTHIDMSFKEFTTQFALGTIKWYSDKEYDRASGDRHIPNSVQYFAIKSKSKEILKWIASHKRLTKEMAIYLSVNDRFSPEIMEIIMGKRIGRVVLRDGNSHHFGRTLIHMLEESKVAVVATPKKK